MEAGKGKFFAKKAFKLRSKVKRKCRFRKAKVYIISIKRFFSSYNKKREQKNRRKKEIN